MQVCMKWNRILQVLVMTFGEKNIPHTDLQSKHRKRQLTLKLQPISEDEPFLTFVCPSPSPARHCQ